MKQTDKSAQDSATKSKSFFGMYKKYIIGGIVILFLIFAIVHPWSVYNYCNTTEADVLAFQNECKNQLSQAITQGKSSDKTLNREEQKLLEVMQIAVNRYDNTGKAFAFIQEQNLQVSPESYAQVRQTLEIYYAQFYATQTSLNDRARAYKHKRSTLVFGFTSRVLGFPTKEYTDARVDQLILEAGVNEAYNSKDRTMPEIPISDGDKAK